MTTVLLLLLTGVLLLLVLMLMLVLVLQMATSTGARVHARVMIRSNLQVSFFCADGWWARATRLYSTKKGARNRYAIIQYKAAPKQERN